MNITLKRRSDGYRSDGILSTAYDNLGNRVIVTLEHAYQQADGSWKPKIPPGVYTCVRGMHQLEGSDHPFETFEITGVAGHSNLLFHSGNWDKDSKGCILTGQAFVKDASGADMIVNSRMAFAHLMKLQDGAESFQLTVIA